MSDNHLAITLHHFTCPISLELPIEPVTMKTDEKKKIYNRHHIETHLASKKTDPLTNAAMEDVHLVEEHGVSMHLQALVDGGCDEPRLKTWADAMKAKQEAVRHANRTERIDKVVKRYKDGQHVRTEFEEAHALYGEIHFFEGGYHVRTEFEASDISHGEVDFMSAGKVARIQFSLPHPRQGETQFFEDGYHVRSMYGGTHGWHGQIRFFDRANRNLRTEYTDFDHPSYGIIKFFGIDGQIVRHHFASTHPDHGQISYFQAGKIVRAEFAHPHRLAGEIHLYDGAQSIHWGKHTRTQFAPFHAQHGETRFLQAGPQFEAFRHVRIEFAGTARFDTLTNRETTSAPSSRTTIPNTARSTSLKAASTCASSSPTAAAGKYST